MSAHRTAYDTYSLPALNYASVDDWLLDGERDRIERAKLNLENNEPERYCWCDELMIHGERVRCPPYHDCDYVRKRSALVERACELTSEKLGYRASGVVFGMRWNAEFVRQMDQLSKPLLNGKNGQHNDTKASERDQKRFQNCEASANRAVRRPEEQRSVQDDATAAFHAFSMRGAS